MSRIPFDVLQEIFIRCDIDTRINIRKAFEDYRLKDRRLLRLHLDLRLSTNTVVNNVFVFTWEEYLVLKIPCNICKEFIIVSIKNTMESSRWFGTIPCQCCPTHKNYIKKLGF